MRDFLDVMETYFRGERAESLYFVLPLAIVSVAFAGALLGFDRTAFGRGVAIPFLVLGLALGGVGATVGFRTERQVSGLRTEYVASRSVFANKELARMREVNRKWPLYLSAWAVFALGGLILRFSLKSDAAQGVGIALVFFGGVGLLIDGFAERRARPYTEALAALATEPP